MNFLKCIILKNVWMMVLCLMISQVLISEADEPLRFSKSALDKEQTHPIKLSIQIYKADRLPIGVAYTTSKQVVDSHAEHMVDLEFSYHLKDPSYHLDSVCKVDDEKLKATITSRLDSDWTLLNIEFDLVVPALKEIIIKSDLTTKFQQELLQEFSSSTEQGIVYVIAIKPEKLDWSKEDKMKGEKMLKDIKAARLRNKKQYEPSLVKLSPMIAKVSKEERDAYLKKIKTVRKIKYSLVDPDLSYIFESGVSVVKSENEGAAPVYDFSEWFGCGGIDLKQPKQPKQWVHYDSGTQTLTGNVDGFVDVRLREFILQDGLDRDFLRITAELVMVDVNEAETIENIKRLEKLGKVTRMQGASQFSRYEKLGYEYQAINLGNSKLKMGGGGLRNGIAGFELSYETERGEKLEFNGYYPTGKDLVMRCELNFGKNLNKDKKELLVLRMDVLDANDRFKKVIPQPDPYLQFTELEPITFSDIREDPFLEGSEEEFKRYKLVNDFFGLISSSSNEGPLRHLVTTPEDRVFDPGDVVYDIKKCLLWEGFNLEDDEIVLLNMSKAELIYKVNSGVELQLEELYQGLKRMTVPRCFKNSIHFYEVDNRQEHDQPWDLAMVLRSKPLNLGSAMIPSSGKVSNKELKVQFLFDEGEEPETWEFRLDVELDYNGETISENYKGDLISGKPMIFELKRGENRSIVAIAVAELIK